MKKEYNYLVQLYYLMKEVLYLVHQHVVWSPEFVCNLFSPWILQNRRYLGIAEYSPSMVVLCVTLAFVCIIKPQFWIPKRLVSSLPKDVKRRICLQMPKCQPIVIPCPLQDKSNFQRFLLLLNFQETQNLHSNIYCEKAICSSTR